MLKITLLFFIPFLNLACTWSQTILNPHFGLKSHETLTIESIQTEGNITRFNMLLENKSFDGYFCADTSIFLILPESKRLNLIKAEGIPVCPESYHFTDYNEKLRFTLIFPSVPDEVTWVDLIENCVDNCFSFNTIVLDDGINRDINNAFTLIKAGKDSEAVSSFEKILESAERRDIPLEGNLLMNLVLLNHKSGESVKMRLYLEKLLKLNTPESIKYLEILRNSGILK